jgi:hypothetical protein
MTPNKGVVLELALQVQPDDRHCRPMDRELSHERLAAPVERGLDVRASQLRDVRA